MLNARRSVGNMGVEPGAVDIAGDLLMITDAAKPTVALPVALLERLRESGRVSDSGWATGDGFERGGQCEQGNVVVMQARQQGAAACVDRGLFRLADEPADFCDMAQIGRAHV